MKLTYESWPAQKAYYMSLLSLEVRDGNDDYKLDLKFGKACPLAMVRRKSLVASGPDFRAIQKYVNSEVDRVKS